MTRFSRISARHSIVLAIIASSLFTIGLLAFFYPTDISNDVKILRGVSFNSEIDNTKLIGDVFLPQGIPDIFEVIKGSGGVNKADGDKRPAVVITHGFTSNKLMMDPFAVQFARAGWIAIIYDARGHGDSEGIFNYGYVPDDGSPPIVAIDMVSVVRQVKDWPIVDSDRVAVLGHSMGALTVLMLGKFFQNDVAGSAAMAPPFKLEAKIDITTPINVNFDPIPYLNSSNSSVPTARNLLHMVGSNDMIVGYESNLRMAAVRTTGSLDGTVQVGVGYNTTPQGFLEGTAYKFVRLEGANHVTEMSNPQAIDTATDWFSQCFNLTSAEISALPSSTPFPEIHDISLFFGGTGAVMLSILGGLYINQLTFFNASKTPRKLKVNHNEYDDSTRDSVMEKPIDFGPMMRRYSLGLIITASIAGILSNIFTYSHITFVLMSDVFLIVTLIELVSIVPYSIIFFLRLCKKWTISLSDIGFSQKNIRMMLFPTSLFGLLMLSFGLFFNLTFIPTMFLTGTGWKRLITFLIMFVFIFTSFLAEILIPNGIYQTFISRETSSSSIRTSRFSVRDIFQNNSAILNSGGFHFLSRGLALSVLLSIALIPRIHADDAVEQLYLPVVIFIPVLFAGMGFFTAFIQKRLQYLPASALVYSATLAYILSFLLPITH